MSAIMKRLLASLRHALAEPIGRGLTDLDPSVLCGLVPGESLLHSFDHLEVCHISFASIHERAVLIPSHCWRRAPGQEALLSPKVTNDASPRRFTH
jgi:hypothetical protein